MPFIINCRSMMSERCSLAEMKCASNFETHRCTHTHIHRSLSVGQFFVSFYLHAASPVHVLHVQVCNVHSMHNITRR